MCSLPSPLRPSASPLSPHQSSFAKCVPSSSSPSEKRREREGPLPLQQQKICCAHDVCFNALAAFCSLSCSTLFHSSALLERRENHPRAVLTGTVAHVCVRVCLSRHIAPVLDHKLPFVVDSVVPFFFILLFGPVAPLSSSLPLSHSILGVF